MVDFKKLREKHRLPPAGVGTSRPPAEARVRDRYTREQELADLPQPQPVLETALHRELRDPDYMDALLDYVDDWAPFSTQIYPIWVPGLLQR